MLLNKMHFDSKLIQRLHKFKNKHCTECSVWKHVRYSDADCQEMDFHVTLLLDFPLVVVEAFLCCLYKVVNSYTNSNRRWLHKGWTSIYGAEKTEIQENHVGLILQKKLQTKTGQTKQTLNSSSQTCLPGFL